MISIFTDSKNQEVARLEGRRTLADLPVSGDYSVTFVLTADDVRAEASRRMQALVGARDAEHLAIIVANGSREAIRLLKIRVDREWTAAEQVRADELDALETAIEAIRKASNILEPAPPEDYADDRWWPALSLLSTFP